MERFLENAMYASRWLLAPVYFGLSLALVALALKFFQEIIHVLPNIFSMAESDLILVLLSLVDMTLVGGWRFAGDGDVFRLREFRLTTRYLREQREAELAGENGRNVAEKQSSSVDCGNFFHSLTARLYGCEKCS